MGSTANLDDSRQLAALIDHTLLKPDATASDIARLCAEARDWNFASVCVNPCWVAYCAEQLKDTPVRVCTVIGFPLGGNTTGIKLAEASAALANGATELDMVQNVGWLRSGLTDAVREEIRQLAAVAHDGGAILKVILENSLLSDDLKATACALALDAQADFVKTSTGFSGGGALVADVKLMRRTVGPKMGVKASGGIKTLEALHHMVRAGANRIGTSSGVSILQELTGKQATAEAVRGASEAAY